MNGVGELGPEDFYIHHRIGRVTFEKLRLKVIDSLQNYYSKQSSLRQRPRVPTNTTNDVSRVSSSLEGDSPHVIKKHMGGLFILFTR